MEPKTILLFNVVAIQLISISSDYWIHIKYRKTSPPPNCNLHTIRQMSILKCANESYSLVQQHSNLYRQCNDMTEGYRRNVSHTGHFYSAACYWFILDPSYTWRNLYFTSFEKDMIALIVSFIAPLSAIIGYFKPNNLKTKARALSFSTFLSVMPILITMHIIHSTNVREPKSEEHYLYYAESGWSLICAIIGAILMGLTSHLCNLHHRRQLERQRSNKRRRQLHNALMSSCRQDIAMAIRARMTVI